MTERARGDGTSWADTVAGDVTLDPKRPAGTQEQRNALAPGERVDHYEVTRLLGRGGMGEVYLARDTALGRRVALKLVHREATLAPEALERLLVEARATARFSHPNIVAIYGAGQHAGMPYVALEYARGQTLRERIDERSAVVVEALRLALQIAQALAEAHRHGVLHCDLKPENVILARDGRVRVLDFGLAVFLGGHDPDAASSARTDGVDGPESERSETSMSVPPGGTPAYMAPEQWQSQPLSGGTDVWALGVMLFELCTGHRPVEEQAAFRLMARLLDDEAARNVTGYRDLPEGVSSLVAACLALDAQRRPSAQDLVQRIGELLHPARRSLEDDVAPFRGLLPFGQQHADFFFGREPQIAALTERMRSAAVHPIVGPSGAGKSSLVQAGLIPRLREQQRWVVVQMRPGADPFRVLAARFLRADSKSTKSPSAWPRAPAPSTASGTEGPRRAADELAERLRQSPRLLALELATLAEQSASMVLLFVDQLEELYTHGHDEQLCRSFIEAICCAADDPDEPVRVVIAMRGDFLDRLAEVPEAREILDNVTVLHRPEPRELSETLTRPLELVGYRFDDDQLAAEMVEAVRGEPSCLPLLQFVAQRLWDERDARAKLLRREAYQGMGGVEGALARHADGVLAGLSPNERGVARELLLRLVTPERTRRVLAKEQALAGTDPAAERVLSRLAEARLITLSGASEAHGDAQIELAHESLIRAWAQLARWLDEAKEEVAFTTEIEEAARLWQKRGRRAGELWRGETLWETKRMVARMEARLSKVAKDFVAGAERRDRSRRRRLRLAVAGAVSLSLLLALVFALQGKRAEEARDHAEEQRQAAEAQRAESLREGARAAFAQEEMLEARAKLRMSLESTDHGAARALWWQLRRHPLVWRQGVGMGVYQVAASGDGTKVAAACQNGTVQIFDVATGARRVLRGRADQVVGVAMSADGQLVASGHVSGTVILWDGSSGARKATLKGLGGVVRGVAFDPSGTRLAFGTGTGQVRIVSAPDGATVAELARSGADVTALVFSERGRSVAVADAQGQVTLHDAAARAAARVMIGEGPVVRSLASSADGALIAAGDQDSRVRVWRAKDAGLLQDLKGHHAAVYGVSFSADGKLLASASYDHTIRLWELERGAAVGVPLVHAAEASSAVFAGAEHLVTAGFDNQVSVWRVPAVLTSVIRGGHTAPVYDAAFSPDGARIASGGGEGRAWVWDARTGAALFEMSHDSSVLALQYTSDGRRLLASSGGNLYVWNASSGALIDKRPAHRGEVILVMSHDATLFATAGEDGGVAIWRTGDVEQIAAFAAHAHAVEALAFRSDGRRLATGGPDREIKLWDVATGAQVGPTLAVNARVNAIGFVPASDELLLGLYDPGLALLDVPSGRMQPLESDLGRVIDIDVEGGARRIAITGSSGDAAVLELPQMTRVTRLAGHRGEVNSAHWSPDGTQLVTSSDDSTVRTWDPHSGIGGWRAPFVSTEPLCLLSHRGWERLSRGAPEEACAPTGIAPPLRHALEERARLARVGGGSALCLVDREGSVELWDRGRGQQRRVARGAFRDVVALEEACVAIGAEAAVVVTAAAERRVSTESPPTALGARPGGAVLAAGKLALSIDERGEEVQRRTVDEGAAAVAELEGDLVVGYPDGSVEIRGDGDPSRATALQQVPASAPQHAVSGPAATVIVGFANGVVGMWSKGDGRLLVQERLHGPVAHLLVRGDTVVAASELGSFLTWDLSALSEERCSMLAELWREVPVVWQDGKLAPREPPADHPCAR